MSTSEVIKTTFFGSPVERCAAKVKKLEAELPHAAAEMAARQRAVTDDILADDEAFAATRKAKHLRDLIGAREYHDGLVGAIVEARSQLADAESAERRAAIALRWHEAGTAADERQKKVVKLHASLTQFAADYRALLEANAALYNALPSVPVDPDAGILLGPLIETAVRLEMVKQGLPWAFDWPYGATEIEDFMPKFEPVPALIRRWGSIGMVA